MSRALDNARKAVEKAAADVARWDGKAFEATSQKAALESSAGDALLDDPTAEDRIGRDLDRLTSQIRTSNTAAETARRRLANARTAALLAEADDEDAAAKIAAKELEKHTARVNELVKQLEELDGVHYEAQTAELAMERWRETLLPRVDVEPAPQPTYMTYRWGAQVELESRDMSPVPPEVGYVSPRLPGQEFTLSRTEILSHAVEVHEVRARVLRYVVENGRTPLYPHEVGVIEVSIAAEFIPDSVHEYITRQKQTA
ncbi:hypothetical protein DBB34_14545 [Sphaerisporangium cinnabarinum]|nr:hypothetical protein [Sphaerisporangium cinnabarinum]PTU55372.1 hypothetical protein DBB34_14545 [Sphaerisporangium cinnabarinum]